MNAPVFETSRSGHLTARLADRWLHSRFDPVREAERYVGSQLPPDAHSVLVVGPALGYLVAAVRSTRPDVRIISCRLLPSLAPRAIARADASWQADERHSLAEFLEREMSDLEASACTILEWPPATETAGELAARVRRTVADFLTRAQASLVTRGAAGRRWIRNAIHNYLYVNPVLPGGPPRRVSAIVVTGAGPSLEMSLPYLRRHRGALEIWASGSSLDALSAAGVMPDLVVVTDPALYATEHLRPVLRANDSGVPLAAPLTAARGVSKSARTVVLSQGEHTDAALLPRDDTAPPYVPPHGTVTATALELARMISEAPLLICGVDFAWRGGRSHARPHLSDLYRASQTNRLLPLSGASYELTHGHTPLADGWTSGRTLHTYADWFVTNGLRRYAPLWILHPSPLTQALPVVDPEDIPTLPRRFEVPGWQTADWPTLEDRTVRARNYLRHLRALHATTEEPEQPTNLDRVAPEFAGLAVQLALPALLRWQRTQSRQARMARWRELCDETAGEVDELEGLIP